MGCVCGGRPSRILDAKKKNWPVRSAETLGGPTPVQYMVLEIISCHSRACLIRLPLARSQAGPWSSS